MRIDGHSIEAMLTVLSPLRSRVSTKPLVIIANTVKGKGVDFMEYQPSAHGIAPKAERADEANISLTKKGLLQ